jgi:hypothetical protein
LVNGSTSPTKSPHAALLFAGREGKILGYVDGLIRSIMMAGSSKPMVSSCAGLYWLLEYRGQSNGPDHFLSDILAIKAADDDEALGRDLRSSIVLSLAVPGTGVQGRRRDVSRASDSGRNRRSAEVVGLVPISEVLGIHIVRTLDGAPWAMILNNDCAVTASRSGARVSTANWCRSELLRSDISLTPYLNAG